MTIDERTPVIVGAAQLRANRGRDPKLARSPLQLLTEAIFAAADDAGADGRALVAQADTIATTDIVSWGYDDLPKLVGYEISAEPSTVISGPMGGNQPGQLLDDVSAAIRSGSSRVAVLGGAEAFASLRAVLATGKAPEWTPGDFAKIDVGEITSELVIRYGLAVPVRCYPLYENAFRAFRGMSFDAVQTESAQLFADFTTVAATQEAAWDPQVLSAAEVGTVTERNRMVCQPYPVRMNAQIGVDQAAAVIVTSAATAIEAGVDPAALVYVHAGAGAADETDIFSRRDFHSSVAMEAVLRAALDRAQITADDIDVLDLYSCFPIVPKLAAATLDRPLGAELTAAGGLSSFGGAGNNYSMHAIVSVAQRLRAAKSVDSGVRGLIYANGGMLTKHHAVVLGTQAPVDGFAGGAVATPAAADVPQVVEPASGSGTIETYTVEYDRSGEPIRGWVVGRTAAGERFPAVVVDAAAVAQLARTEVEQVGRHGALGQMDAAEFGKATSVDTGRLTTFTPAE